MRLDIKPAAQACTKCQTNSSTCARKIQHWFYIHTCTSVHELLFYLKLIKNPILQNPILDVHSGVLRIGKFRTEISKKIMYRCIFETAIQNASIISLLKVIN